MKNKKFWISLIAGFMAAVMLFCLIVSILPQQASAKQSSSEIKEQINELKEQYAAQEEQIKELEGQQSENLSDIRDIIAQKAILEEKAGLLYANVQLMNEQIAAYNVLIADKQEELEKAQQYLEELSDKHKERIRAMEEDGELSYWSVLFEANNFFELLDRLNMVQEIAAADSRRLQQLREAAAEVEEAQAILIAEREELDLAKEELHAAQAELAASSEEAQEILNQLAARADEYASLMEEYEDALDNLVEELGNAEIEYDKAVYEEYMATMTTAPPPTKPANNYKPAYGGTTVVDESGITWVIPCSYTRVASPYGDRIHPVYGDWRFHNGVDLAATCQMKKDGTTDSPIYASRSGVVVVSKYSSSGGWTVTIDHLDGYKTSYLHMCCRPFVSVGDMVGAGQVIGCIGSTGVSTGDHLHFTVYKYNESKKVWETKNPMDYIG